MEPRIGWGVSYGLRLTRSGAGRVVAIVVATCIWILACASGVIIVSSYEGRDIRTAARGVVVNSAEQAKFLWSSSPGNVGTEAAFIFYGRPLTQDAPPPPGVTAWPKPGETVASPRLKELLVNPANWTTFATGEIVGTIDPDALATPDEIFAYINPSADASLISGAMVPGLRFGGSAGADWGAESLTFGLNYALLPYLFLLVLPAGLLLVAAWLLNHGRRAEQVRRLRLIGATRKQLLMMYAPASLLPCALGALVALGVLTALSVVDVRLPGAHYQLRSDDLRRSSVALVLVTALAFISAAVVVLIPPRPPAKRSHRSWRRPSRGQIVIAAICLGSLVLAIPFARLLIPLSSVPLGVPDTIFLGALAVALCTLSFLTSVITHLVAELLRRLPGAAAIVGAGLLRGSRRHVVIVGAGLAGILSVLIVVDGYAVLLNAPSPAAAKAYRSTLGHVVEVRSTSLSGPMGMPKYHQLDELGDKSVLVAADPASGEVRVFTADPESSVDSTDECGQPDFPRELREALRYHGISSCVLPMSRAVVDDFKEASVILYRATPDFSPSIVSQLVAEWTTPPPAVTVPGADWVIGGVSGAWQGRWLGWYGAIGLVITVSGIWLLASSDIRQATRRIAGYLVLGAEASLAWKAMAIRIMAPTIAALASVGIFSWETRFYFYTDAVIRSDTPVYVIYAVAVLVTTTAVVCVTALGGQRAVATWRPGQERE